MKRNYNDMMPHDTGQLTIKTIITWSAVGLLMWCGIYLLVAAIV